MKNIKDLMSQNVEVVVPSSSVKDAASKMKELDTGALPVCDGERLVGMITDRDITIRAVAEGKDLDQCQVQEIMTKPISYCYEDQGAEEAIKMMSEKKVRRLVVVNRDKRLVGIISLGDLAAVGTQATEALKKVSEPASKKVA